MVPLYFVLDYLPCSLTLKLNLVGYHSVIGPSTGRNGNIAVALFLGCILRISCFKHMELVTVVAGPLGENRNILHKSDFVGGMVVTFQ